MVKGSYFFALLFWVGTFTQLEAQSWELPATEIASDQGAFTFTPPEIVYWDNGDGLCVWTVFSLTPEFILKSLYYDGVTDTWDATPTVIAVTSGPVFNLNLGKDSAGNAYLAYVGNYDLPDGSIKFRKFDGASRSWGAEQAGIGSVVGTELDFAVNASGNGLAVWTERVGGNNVVNSARYDSGSGTWVNTGIISETNVTGNPFVAINDAGDGLAAWRKTISTGTRAAWFDSQTLSWQDTGALATVLESAGSRVSSLVLSNNGDGVVSLAYDSPIRLGLANFDGTTKTWFNTEGSLVDYGTFWNDAPVGMDDDGNALVVYGSQATSDINAVRFTKATNTWGSPTFLLAGGTSPDPVIAVDGATGNAVVIVSDTNQSSSTVSLYSSSYQAASDSWLNTGAQAILLDTVNEFYRSRLSMNVYGNALGLWCNSSDIDYYAAKYYLPVIGPTALTGQVKKNISINQIDRIHQLSWVASSDTSVEGYIIRANGVTKAVLVGRNSTAVSFHNQRVNMPVTYAITAYSATGQESNPPLYVTIK